MANEMVTFKTDNGDVVKLTPSIVRNYISNNPAITDAEIYGFLELCKYQKLNPFLREVYIVKYGSNPATIVTGKETFTKRAQRHPNFNGYEAGIILENNGKLERRDGGMMLPTEKIVGGWAKVYSKATEHPVSVEVAFEEYIQKKTDGTPNKFWKEKPATMIRKVALVQALREAFPDYFAGLFSAEEMPVDMDKLPTKAIEVTDITDEPEYITDEQYAVLQSIWGSDKAKQIQAVKVFDKYGIPQKHPKFQKQYRAIPTGRIFDEIHSEILMMTEGAKAEVVHPVIEIEPVVEDELPDSYEPEPTEDEKPYADYVPYSGKHKYASKRLDEIPHWFLEQVANTAVADDNWKKRNTEIKEKVLAFLEKSSYNEDEPTINPPFDLD